MPDCPRGNAGNGGVSPGGAAVVRYGSLRTGRIPLGMVRKEITNVYDRNTNPMFLKEKKLLWNKAANVFCKNGFLCSFCENSLSQKIQNGNE